MEHENKTCDILKIIHCFEIIFSRNVYEYTAGDILNGLQTLSLSKKEYRYVTALLGIPQRQASINNDKIIKQITIKKILGVLYVVRDAIAADVNRGYCLSCCKVDFQKCKRYIINYVERIRQQQPMNRHLILCLLSLWCDCLQINKEWYAQIVYNDGLVSVEYLSDYETDEAIGVQINKNTIITPWQALHSTDETVRKIVDNTVCDIVCTTKQCIYILGAKTTLNRCTTAASIQSTHYVSAEQYAKLSKYIAEYKTVLEQVTAKRQWDAFVFYKLRPFLVVKLNDFCWYYAEDIIKRGLDTHESILAIGVHSDLAENSTKYLKNSEYKQYLLDTVYWVVTCATIQDDLIINDLHRFYKQQQDKLRQRDPGVTKQDTTEKQQGKRVGIFKNKQNNKTAPGDCDTANNTEESVGFVCQSTDSDVNLLGVLRKFMFK